MDARMALSSGVWENLTSIKVPPRKSIPSGTPCQNSMENTPATLNTRENARKYHFLPRKSMFGLRKNSTPLRTPFLCPRYSTPDEASGATSALPLSYAQRFAALFAGQQPVED